MRRPDWLLITLPIVASFIGASRIEAQSHADAAAPKAAHGRTDTPTASKARTGQDDTHAVKVAPAAQPAPASKDSHAPKEAHAHAVATPATLKPPTHELSDPSAGRHGSQDRSSRSTRPAASPSDRQETQDEPARHVPHARPPNPALEAVLQRIARRVSGAKPARGSTARAPRTTAAASPLFRVQVTAPHAPSPSETPRVRLTWRPTVVWPRAVLPGGDADTRVQVDWSH